MPYGLWKLSQARDSKFLVLVEGESDCWTLWHHGLPALGIPGAAMVACMHGEHLANVSNLFIIREPDAGGAAFVLGIAKRLGETHWRGQVSVVSLEGAKDPSELHKSSPEAFKEKFHLALDSADP